MRDSFITSVLTRSTTIFDELDYLVVRLANHGQGVLKLIFIRHETTIAPIMIARGTRSILSLLAPRKSHGFLSFSDGLSTDVR